MNYDGPKEMIEVTPLKGQRCGNDIFAAVWDYYETKVPLLSVDTDGISKMQDFVSLPQRLLDRKPLSFHCIVH